MIFQQVREIQRPPPPAESARTLCEARHRELPFRKTEPPETHAPDSAPAGSASRPQGSHPPAAAASIPDSVKQNAHAAPDREWCPEIRKTWLTCRRLLPDATAHAGSGRSAGSAAQISLTGGPAAKGDWHTVQTDRPSGYAPVRPAIPGPSLQLH